MTVGSVICVLPIGCLKSLLIRPSQCLGLACHIGKACGQSLPHLDHVTPSLSSRKCNLPVSTECDLLHLNRLIITSGGLS